MTALARDAFDDVFGLRRGLVTKPPERGDEYVLDTNGYSYWPLLESGRGWVSDDAAIEWVSVGAMQTPSGYRWATVSHRDATEGVAQLHVSTATVDAVLTGEADEALERMRARTTMMSTSYGDADTFTAERVAAACARSAFKDLLANTPGR